MSADNTEMATTMSIHKQPHIITQLGTMRIYNKAIRYMHMHSVLTGKSYPTCTYSVSKTHLYYHSHLLTETHSDSNQTWDILCLVDPHTLQNTDAPA